MVDVFPEVYKLVRLVVHWSVACMLNVAVDSGIPFARKHMISVSASDTVSKRRAHDHDHPHHLPRLLG